LVSYAPPLSNYLHLPVTPSLNLSLLSPTSQHTSTQRLPPTLLALLNLLLINRPGVSPFGSVHPLFARHIADFAEKPIGVELPPYAFGNAVGDFANVLVAGYVGLFEVFYCVASAVSGAFLKAEWERKRQGVILKMQHGCSSISRKGGK